MVAAGTVVTRLTGGREGLPGVAVVVGAAAAILFAIHVWSPLDRFRGDHRTLSGLTAYEAAIAPGEALGQNVRFLKSAKDRMAPGDTFAVMPPDLVLRLDSFEKYQWTTYQLSPHRSVRPDDADWLVFVGADPASVDYERADFTEPAVFEPGFALARRHDAR